ncbi:MAG TPA: DNRLRE domain-containing protein [Anaerohalosphaeraceae bacterium]|nr:DNRLRE domain-containing protein [Anaerohalosphaeraceae bacterium]
MNAGLYSLIAAVLFCMMSGGAWAVPAFPGAQGYGAAASGGRGGEVYFVTNLNDSGPGSLRDALNHNTPRTIIFRVSGTIHLQSNLDIKYPNVTIAGQTAPGQGICIANGSLYCGYDNVIIRYIRCRLGDQWPDGTPNGDDDAVWGRGGNRIILDHVSASWSVDETFSFYTNSNFTAQWCMITESLRYSHHEKGPHGYGGIWGGTNSSWHHNLLAHHSSRNPRIEGDVVENVDLRNNVIYNWGFNSCYGGEKASVNIVNCYYKYGPATGSGVRYRIANPSLQKDASGAAVVPHSYGQWYISGNYVYGNAAVTNDNWLGVNPEGGDAERSLCRAQTPFPEAQIYPVATQSPQEAFESVLNEAGCSLYRDAVDARIVSEVRSGTASGSGQTGEGLGIIDSQTAVGGWPPLETLPAPPDSDNDGMPDGWELTHGLNPAYAADRNGDRDGDGYTNLEEYLNWLCTPAARADLNRNCVIDLGDFAVLAASWKTRPGQALWNPFCDIARPANGVVDLSDLQVLAENWCNQPQAAQPLTKVNIIARQGKAIQYKNDSGAWISETRLKTRTSGQWDPDPLLNTLDANKSYLQFDISGFGGTIVQATLTIYAITDAKSYTVSGLLDGVDEAWRMDTIDWFNAPGNDTQSGSALNPAQTVLLYSVNPTAADTAASGDVTAFVCADTDGLVTFILTAGGTTYLYNVIEGAYFNAAYVPVLTLEGILTPAG